MTLEFDDQGQPRVKPVPAVKKYIDVIVPAIVETAEEWDGEIRRYAGRFMYRRKCLSVIVGDSVGFLEDAAERASESKRAAGIALIEGAAVDTWGTERVVYWPDIDPPDDLNYEEDYEEAMRRIHEGPGDEAE
jgi:hypothetical protein